MTDLSPEVVKAIEQVEKLLRLAGKNTNQNEAAAATAKAMEILAKYNLDMSVVEQNSGSTSGKREDTKFEGGLYQYQRDLWRAVAELNFCMYWNQYTYDPNKARRKADSFGSRKGGYKFQHRLVGRTVNVVSTRAMAEYLLQAIERLTRERYPDPSQFFTRSATSFREGLAETVIDKISERRKHVLKEEQIKQRAAKKAADEAARKGVSTATTLTIADVTKSESDANIDFMYGEGTSARWAAETAATAAENRKKREAYTKWAKENPEEARKEEEERRKSRRTSWNAGIGDGGKKRDYSAYYQGMDKGKDISIDLQTGDRRAAGKLR